ncbi:MAG: hypothetical protein IJ534_01815 [Bacteroidaceae bacterium]|nr:hypothetical protein [Bacteroidaceae bacterium]
MNYFSRIKPVLNKLSELNVYDSLYVVRAYMQACMDGDIKKEYIPNVRYSEANSIEVWFADFMIANIIKYCSDIPCSKSLRDVKTRYYICTPIEELHREVTKKQMNQEVFVWINSYIFNQYKILARDNELRVLYRYYYLYKTPRIKFFAENKMSIPLDVYFKMAFFVYVIFAGKGRFYVKEDYISPKKKFNEVNKMALDYVLSQISKPLSELKLLCKNYCCYEEDSLFGYFNDAPHVRFPLIKDKGGFFCTIPSYIPTALLDGLYYRLDIPNCGDHDVNKEFSENMENYIGMIFEHFLEGSQVKYQQELTYDVGKRRTQRTSDWILWDETDISFMDCKTKRISVKGKQAVTVDDEMINQVVRDKPFSNTRKKKEIDEAIPEGLTKDLIHLGIGVGKIFVSYDEYQAGNVSGFPYMKGKRFHAVIVTLEESFSNTPGYKERIIKVAQSYRDAKSCNSKPIDEKTVKVLSVKDLEECTCIIAQEGLGFYMDHHMHRELMAQKYIMDKFLVDKCNEELINPFLEELKAYFE